jgi:hypothetical protein
LRLQILIRFTKGYLAMQRSRALIYLNSSHS